MFFLKLSITVRKKGSYRRRNSTFLYETKALKDIYKNDASQNTAWISSIRTETKITSSCEIHPLTFDAINFAYGAGGLGWGAGGGGVSGLVRAPILLSVAVRRKPVKCHVNHRKTKASRSRRYRCRNVYQYTHIYGSLRSRQRFVV